jgi:ornithine cyclodeaminase
MVKVEERDNTGGFLKTRLQKVKELCATVPNAYWTNQYGNLDAIEAHYELTAAEICADFDSLDYVFIGVSTAGTIAGVSRRLKEHYPNIRVIAVDTEGSAIFGGPPRKRHIPGIGSSIVPPLLSYADIDDVVLISERETVAACRELLTTHALFVGGFSGTAFAAVKRYAAKMPAYKHSTVLFLCADRGTPYLDTVFDPTWGNQARIGEAMHFELSIINGKTVSDIIRTHRDECIGIVRDAYLAHARGQTVNPDSYFLRFPGKPDCRIIALPAYLGNGFGVAGLKWIASYPANIQRGFPRASAVLVLNSYDTGYPFAILESSIISAARTAASAVLAAYWLNGQSRRAHSLGIVGTGFIARYVYDFLVDTGWELDEVRLYDTSPRESEKFRDRACHAEHHRTVTIVPDVAQLVRSCDLILFTTVASGPHIDDVALFEHNPLVLHISLRDLAPEILLRSQNVVDDVDHVMKANTSPHLAEQKMGNRSFVTGSLADIMIGRRPHDGWRWLHDRGWRICPLRRDDG